MRLVLLIAMLSTLAFAGCIEGNLGTDSSSEKPELNSAEAQIPARRFEPELMFEAAIPNLEQGDTVDLTFSITDLHDYTFPLSFIDWTVSYTREPNPVEEGDATELPGTYQRALYAVDYHVFCFEANDGQGFAQLAELIVKVGEPEGEPDACIPKLIEGAVAAVDPCATAPTQETIARSGTALIGGAAGSGFISNIKFEVLECQSVIDVLYEGTAADVMLDLLDPSGAKVASSDANFVGSEILRYEPGTPLPPGEWTVTVRPYAGGPDPYDLTIKFA